MPGLLPFRSGSKRCEYLLKSNYFTWKSSENIFCSFFSKLFYFSHLLYVLYWILLLFHSPNFWIWFIAPCSIFFLERIYRMAKTFSEKGKTETKLGLILASKVVHLVINRPKNFKFKAGDYIFINIPTITKYQWHPFTISSAPEQNDIRWKHVYPVVLKSRPCENSLADICTSARLVGERFYDL